jgi:hypothetical protein
MILNSVQWMTEVLDNQKELEYSTLTHITIWNNQQCTGRIPLTDIYKDLAYQRTKSVGEWSFNDFRDMVKTYGVEFLRDLFNNYNVIEDEINLNKPWYEQGVMEGKFFTIRFEFDNTTGKQLILHEAKISANKSTR